MGLDREQAAAHLGRLGIAASEISHDPFDHLCLRVCGDGVDHIGDVGFGASFRRPLPFVLDQPQHDVEGVFELRRTDDDRIELAQDGAAQYSFGTRPHGLADFAGGCIHHTTSPDSHVTRSTVCTRATKGGRATISGRTLKVTDGEGTSEREVDDDTELLALYRTHLGIDLDRVPTVRHGG